MDWHHRSKAPDEKVRDPIQGEFFSTEAIKNPADALVREAVQNAMDATLRDSAGQPKDMLRVRFFLATGPPALSARQAGGWFDGTWGPLPCPGQWTSRTADKNRAVPVSRVRRLHNDGT
jgi:hypothetical protein